METKEIKVGDYIRGFKHNCSVSLFERMNNLIGEVGKVIDVKDNVIFVEFKNQTGWWYPKHQAIEHLCNDDMKELEHPKVLSGDGNELFFDEQGNMIKKVEGEELESHFKDPKLYSVLLSLGKIRMVYIDQTDEDVEQIKKQSPNWHTIIVEQQQDKGIQIIIKS
jgi:hypothetical protein